MDPSTIIDLLKVGGLTGGLGVFIWLLYTRKLVWGWQFDELKVELTKKQALLEEATKVAAEAIEFMKRPKRP